MIQAIEPWAHQVEGVRRAQGKLGFAFFFEAGTGKTYTCIKTILNNGGLSGRVLIFCPPIVCENWKREWEKFAGVSEDDILVLRGPGKKRVEALKSSSARIVITNYESLLMNDLFELFCKTPFSFLVVDECQKIKDPTSQRTKKMIILSDKLRSKNYLLSGTPVLNSLMDLWSQFRVLDGGFTLGKNFFAFRNTYFFDRNANAPSYVKHRDWQLRPGAESIIKDKIKDFSMHVKKEQCLDLPPLLTKKIFVSMGKEQKRVYDSMEKDFISLVGSEAAVAELVITKALRLQQIVSGFVPVEIGGGDRKNISFDDNPRIDALEELLLEYTPKSKVIVWAVFKENFVQIAKLCERLGLKFVEVHGEVKNKQEAVDEFNTNDDCRVFIGHPGSGGIGINLVVSNVSIFYSRNFSLENDIQAEARNNRGGSEIHDSLLRIDLVCNNSIDEQILTALDNKQQIGVKVLLAWANRKKDVRQ